MCFSHIFTDSASSDRVDIPPCLSRLYLSPRLPSRSYEFAVSPLRHVISCTDLFVSSAWWLPLPSRPFTVSAPFSFICISCVPFHLILSISKIVFVVIHFQRPSFPHVSQTFTRRPPSYFARIPGISFRNRSHYSSLSVVPIAFNLTTSCSSASLLYALVSSPPAPLITLHVYVAPVASCSSICSSPLCIYSRP